MQKENEEHEKRKGYLEKEKEGEQGEKKGGKSLKDETGFKRN